jgi:hypothetical protein
MNEHDGLQMKGKGAVVVAKGGSPATPKQVQKTQKQKQKKTVEAAGSGTKWTWRNNPVLNVLLLVAVPLPSVAFMWFLSHTCTDASALASLSSSWRVSLPEPVASLLGVAADGASVGPEQVCGWSMEHPLALLNVLFFLNVDVLFWLISVFQGSTWVRLE